MKLSSAKLNANRPKLSRIPLFCVLSFTGTSVREATEQSDFRRLSDLGFLFFFNHKRRAHLWMSLLLFSSYTEHIAYFNPASETKICFLHLSLKAWKNVVKKRDKNLATLSLHMLFSSNQLINQSPAAASGSYFWTVLLNQVDVRSGLLQYSTKDQEMQYI